MRQLMMLAAIVVWQGSIGNAIYDSGPFPAPEYRLVDRGDGGTLYVEEKYKVCDHMGKMTESWRDSPDFFKHTVYSKVIRELLKK